MRKGFSMITAIIFMILVATLGALALSLSTTTTKQTSDLFLREQAELLLQSSAEYALLAISGHEINATNGCLNTININYPATNTLFDINITINYLGNGLPAGCMTFDGLTTGLSSSNIDTNESNRTVILDIVVRDHNLSTEPIRLHRRTIQKP